MTELASPLHAMESSNFQNSFTVNSFGMSNSRLRMQGSSARFNTSFLNRSQAAVRKKLPAKMSELGERSVMLSDLGSSVSGEFGQSSRGFQKWAHHTVKFSAKNFVNRKGGTMEDDYQIGEMVGSGGFGEVYSAVHLPSGSERAVKVVAKLEDAEKNEEVMHEFNVVKDLDHPNVLKLYELYEDEKCFYIITDLYRGGELYDELEQCGRFCEDDTAVLMNTVLSCINYCHKNNLAHRDLKPENILLDETKCFDDVKIIDFGLASFYDTDKGLSDRKGTIYYMSPQVIEGAYSPKCDVWAIGILTYVCLAGCAPFDGETDEEVMGRILDDEWYFDGPGWEQVSEEARDFIAQLLSYDEDKRPSAEEALNHPWLKDIRGRSSANPKQLASTRKSLAGMKSFTAQHSKLKQAVCSMIASQLLAKEEKEEIDVVFRSLDVDCDGLLTKEDIKKGYREHMGQTISDSEIANIFAQVNYSGTGAVSYSEFVVTSLLESDLIDDDKVQSAFELFDKEDKGYISVDDLKETLGLDDSMDGYVKQKIIRQVNTTGNGRISAEEFFAMMFSHDFSQSSRLQQMSKTANASRSAYGMHGSTMAKSFTIDEDYSVTEDETSAFSSFNASTSFSNMCRIVKERIHEKKDSR